jgi:zinc/manganese transport system substrate-binding protein
MLPRSPKLVALGCAAALAGCAGTADSGGRIPVVAAENFYGNIVGQVGGARVAVTSIIKDPAADPHEYTGKVDDTEAVAHARLVVVNGAGYDAFMERLLAATPTSGRTVIHVDKLARVRGPDPNPHLWYDSRVAVAVARATASTLAHVDPGHAAAYREGAARFVASLAALETEIVSLHKRFAGVPFAYTERVPGYLTDRIGLSLQTPSAFARADEQGTDPPPQAVATMRGLITAHRIRLLVYNRQASSPAASDIRALARHAGIPVVGVSETSPRGESYQQWQLDQLHAIDRALSR